MRKKVKILSLDGGGLRGIVPVLILKRIEEMTGKKIHELFDVIVGTSTGGIIACGLSCTKDGVTPLLTIDKLIELYTTKGDVIFPAKKNFITKTIGGINSIFNPKFSPKGLDGLLTEYFGDLTLIDTLVPVIVTSYDVKNNEPLIFKTRNAVWDKNLYNAKLKDVCRATSAAPTFLPSYEMEYGGKSRICIDGGIYINNPAMAGVSDVLRSIEGLNIKDIECLSLGTGVYSENLGIKNTPSWGLLKWAKPISTLMMQAGSKATAYECNEILKKHLRLQICIGEESKSDMSDSRPETAKYIIDKVHEDILDNEKVMNSIKRFFK
jgi:patatin-like phospholipase/acyl hydrolase